MRRIVILGFLLIGLAAWAAPAPARPPDKAKEKEPAPPAVPEDAIIAIFDRLADAMEKSPRHLLLSPEKYQALLDDIKRLEILAARTRAGRPSICRIEKGRFAGNLFTFTATFEFRTGKAGESVRLACGQAQATGVSLDRERTPRLRRPPAEKGDAEGFVVEVDEPGEHSLTLDLVMAVSSKAGGQALTLDLPGAAVTTIELELPERVRDVRLGGRPVAETTLKRAGGKLTGPPINAEKLELTWLPARADGIATVTRAEGAVTARLDAKELTTEARLTLRVQSGQVKEWRLLVPPKAELKFSPEEQSRIARVDATDQKRASLRTIHLKAASSEPLGVVVTHTQPAPAPASGKAASIGPFVVVGAARHAGGLLVCNAVPGWHPEFTPHGDLTRRSLTDDEQKREPNGVAAFRYGPGGGEGPWLDVEVESVRGQIKTKASHKLRLKADAGGARWHVLTSLEIVPRWSDVDRVAVQLPPGCTLREEGQFPLPDRVRSIAEDPATRLVTIRLARGAGGERSLAPVLVELEAVYPGRIDPDAPGKAVLALPVAVGAARAEGTITVATPAGIELLAPEASSAWAGLEVVSRTAQEVVLRYGRRAPAEVPVSWGPHRPEVVVANRADVALTAGEVRVRQELRYSWPAGPMPGLAVRVPREVAGSLRTQGGRLVGLEGASGAGGVKGILPDVTARQGHALLVVLDYAYPLPRTNGGTATLPLVAPVDFTRGDARVRLWSDPENLPGRAGAWAEQNIEAVPGRARLPVLVLHSSKADLPLRVTLAERTGLFALVERSLVRVEIGGNGSQTYRVGYRLARLEGRWLDFELPAPEASIGLRATIGGKQLTPELLPTQDAGMKNRIVRLRPPPSPPGSPALLELAYTRGADRVGGSPLMTPLVAPRLLGETEHIPTRWAVVTPPSYVVLGPEMGGTPRSWSRRGWLPAPRVAISAADLERWLLDADPPPAEPAAAPSLVLWHDGSSPVRLIHMPQQAWLLVCSLGLVLAGLVLARLVSGKEGGPSGIRVGLVLGGIAAGLVVAGLFAPNLLGQVAYGCQPGVLVLVVLVGIQRLLHERYRRQVVFLPSFTRASRGKGSSLHRPEPRPHGQPSTVDAPRPIGSSVERLG